MSEQVLSQKDSTLREIDQSELQQHNNKQDPWLAVGGRVYAVKEYMSQHPGGAEVLMEKAGGDATEDFKQIGHGSNARSIMTKYVIGKKKGDKLLSDEELSASSGEGNKWFVFAIIAVIVAYIYFNKFKKNAIA